MDYQQDGFVYFQSKKDLRNNGGLTEGQWYFIDEIKRSCAFYFYGNNRRYILTASYANADQTPPEYYISDFETRQRKQAPDLERAKNELRKLSVHGETLKTRKNFGAKAILYPMPVLIIGTYDENGKPNAMNAAWGGISEETEISICVDNGHKTAKNVVKAGAFTVSIADAENVVVCDYVGIASGNKELNKIEKAGWHATKSEFVNAPLFDELPMALECKLISYDEATYRLVGEIVNVCADERILGSDGKIDLDKFSPITFDPVHHVYRKIGDVVGKAFSDGVVLK